MTVSFDPGQETNDFETSNSVFSSVELEIRAIVSFKVISWYSGGVCPQTPLNGLGLTVILVCKSQGKVREFHIVWKVATRLSARKNITVK